MSTQAPTVFVLPEQAHLDLIEVRNHLRLLTRLAGDYTVARAHWCFARLSRDIDAILQAMHVADDAARTVPQPGQ